MSDNSGSLNFSTSIAASPEQLYTAFTNATALREWLCDIATTSPRDGGHIFLAWNDGYSSRGSFSGLKENEAVSFGWHGGEPAATQVQVALSGNAEATALALVHSGLGVGDEWDVARAEFEKGWNLSLENLKSVMETGADIRFVSRPMLGITVGDFNKEVAVELGIPVSEGIRLDNVIPEMGAAAAGLQSNDVVVQIGTHPVTDWPSLQAALQGHRAGETVEVVYYRSGTIQTLDMLLSGRPIPEIPFDILKLASRVSERYVEPTAALERFLSEVSEEEASFRAAPGQWSVNEIIAHLIHGEEGWRVYMSDLIGGQEPLYDDFGGNVHARNAGTLAVYPTKSDLLAALKRQQDETIAMVANIPASFLARKGSYWRLAYTLLQSPFHTYSHMEQMQASVAAARHN